MADVLVPILWLLLWFTILIFSSFLLSLGAESLSYKLGGKFVGRTILSITTTLPEIFIVASAALRGFHGTAMGSAFGSNILMMTVGLSIMVIVATTSLARVRLKEVKVDEFRLDMIFLVVSALVAVILFYDGYSLLDGVIFLAMFVAYLIFAFYEGKKEAKKIDNKEAHGSPGKGAALLAVGGAGLFIAALPFVLALEGVSAAIGVAPIVIALILSPIAGEMPEKLAIIILARKGERGVSIAVANVLGSKVLNNTLLLAVMIFAALYTVTPVIQPTGILPFTVAWAAVITIIAIFLMARRRRLVLRDAVILTSLYIGTIALQFLLS
ncbi:MAG: hypothetical protein O6846_04620 [Thaumarchaeota archaeon]|nr:hypothetical protein [Nitrososphaerota archaeon]